MSGRQANKQPRNRGAVEFHDALAAGWDGNYGKKSFGDRLQALEQILGSLDLRDQRWLDAGCGTGTLSRWLAERGASVLGLDASPDMVRGASELSAQHPCRDRLRFELIGNIEDVDVPPSSFDGILCSSVLEYLDEPARCLSGFHHALREDGVLLISVPNAKSVLRRVLLLIHRITGRFGSAWPAYLLYSRNQYSRIGFESLLRSRGFASCQSVIVGGPMPLFLRRREALGSLIMVMAEKRNDRPGE